MSTDMNLAPRVEIVLFNMSFDSKREAVGSLGIFQSVTTNYKVDTILIFLMRSMITDCIGISDFTSSRNL